MAITVQMREQVSQLYVALFGRAPDGEGLGYWVGQLDAGKTMVDVANTMYATAPARVLYPSFLTNQEIIGNFYTNVLGRTADADGLAFWTAKLNAAGATAGSVIAEMINIVANYSGTDPAGLTSQALFNNKVAVAQWYGEQNGNIAGANTVLAAVTSDPASVNAAKTGGAQSGETFMLTKGLDNIQGTAGNDTIIGSIPAAAGAGGDLDTLSTLDVVNGGAGIDTLKISNAAVTTASLLPNMTSVEVVEYSSTDTAEIDTSAYTDVTTLNIVKVGAAKKVDATAANTTDINVTLKAAGAVVGTDGGKNVTVKLTDVAAAADVVTVGAAVATGAAGDVVVEMTGAKTVAATNKTLSAINVNGGKTISVTQKATSDASAAAADGTGATITQGKVTIKAAAATTDITVKQDANVAATLAASASGGVTETASVKFQDLGAGKTVILGGLTFKAGADDLTAAEVASAFANLAAGAAIPRNAALTAADGDTQGSAAAAKGTFTGSLKNWTTGAATGDTVVFTSTIANSNEANLTDGGNGTKAIVITTTDGKANDATATGGVLGVKAGVVDITGDAAVKTITVDGYDTTAAAATNKIQGATNTVLDTINLSNGGGMTIASAAATLALNLEKANGEITFTAAPTTLNVKSTGDNTLDKLIAAATTALNVSGTGTLSAATTATLTNTKTIKVTETAGLTLAAGGLGALTSVDTTGTTGTVTVTIDATAATYAGGAGVDKVTVGDAIVGKALNLGGGNDRLDMSALTTKKVPTVDIDGGAGDADVLVLAAASADKTKISADTTFGAKIKNFERLELGTAADDFDVTLSNLGLTNYVITNGVVTGKTLILDKLAANATIELATANPAAAGTEGTINAKLADATGATDVLNLITKVAAAGDFFGTLQADGVETLNLNALDTKLDNNDDGKNDAVDTATLNLSSDKAKALNIEGNSDVKLDITAALKIATIDAGTLTGALTATANGATGVEMTITGGSGNDVLTASAALKTIIFGGDGNDTIVAGSVSSDLTGGAGNDLFIMKDLAGNGTGGNKDADSYSIIKDFAAGDLLQLVWTDKANASAQKMAVSFTKLVTALQDETASLQSFANAAAEQAGLGDAVWFNYKGHAYVVVDSDTNSSGAGFVGTEDLIIRLQGVKGEDLSFNSDFGTVALI